MSYYNEIKNKIIDNEVYSKVKDQKRKLDLIIKRKEYYWIPKEIRNKLVNNQKVEIKYLVPNLILVKNKNNIDIINEKALHQLILEDIESFMKELGNSFSFIDSEYKIKIRGNYHKMDLLLFNIKEIGNNDTIGILICKKENKFVIEYNSDDRITLREYELVWYNKSKRWKIWHHH